MLSQYASEFSLIALAHLAAVASPGPDFAMVLRQSLTRGRRTALWTSLGIGTGIFLHVTYSLLGIGIIISQSVMAFTVMKFVAAAYLMYIGVKSLRAKPAPIQAVVPAHSQPRKRTAYWTGVMTNALNPKATLFFVSLFTVVISHTTPIAVQAAYGLYMALATACWFCCLSCVLTQAPVQNFFQRFGHWVDRCVGTVLLGLGVRLVLSKAHSL